MTVQTAFGPQGPNYATVRPPADPKASAGIDTWFKNCSAAGAKDGTFATADFFNVTLGNLRYLVRHSGISLDDADDTMVYNAVQSIASSFATQNEAYAVDTGAVNALAISLPSVTTYTEGFAVFVKVANTNTAPSTIRLNALTVKNVSRQGGGALQAGDLMRGAVVLFVYDGAAFQLLGPTTNVLTAPRDYYVDGGLGSDSNSGLDAGHAFATLQRVANEIARFNLNGYSVVVHIADWVGNAYAPVYLGQYGGSGSVTFVGNTVTPSNVLIASGAGPAVTCSFGGYTMRGCKVTSTAGNPTVGSPGAGVASIGAGNIVLDTMEYGFCVDGQVYAYAGGTCTVTGLQKVSGSSASFLSAAIGAMVIVISGASVAVTTPVTVTNFAAASVNSNIVGAFGGGISGAGNVTGSKFAVSGNGVINTGGGGASYYPGTTAGTQQTGGQYL